jgi:hypothetical protein
VAYLDVSARPNYGSHDLSATSDPLRIELKAGGAMRSDSLPTRGGGRCVASYIDDAPDVRLRYRDEGTGPVRIAVDGRGSDTTLAVHVPGGGWLCSDDAVGEDPEVVIPHPRPGDYAVFVGTVAQGTYPEVQVVVHVGRPPGR